MPLAFFLVKERDATYSVVFFTRARAFPSPSSPTLRSHSSISIFLIFSSFLLLSLFFLSSCFLLLSFSLFSSCPCLGLSRSLQVPSQTVARDDRSHPFSRDGTRTKRSFVSLCVLRVPTNRVSGLSSIDDCAPKLSKLCPFVC